MIRLAPSSFVHSFGAVAVATALVGCAPHGVIQLVDGIEPRFVSPKNVLVPRWRRHITEEPLIEYKPQEFAAAAIGGDKVFVGASQGNFYAFRAYDGEIIWRKKTVGPIESQPLYVEATHTVYLGGTDGILYALDSETGAERFQYRTQGPIGPVPVVSGDVVYFTTGENRIYAIDALSGTWKWQYEREVPEQSFTVRGSSAPLVVGEMIYVGFADGSIVCIQAKSGEVLWARSLAQEGLHFVDVDSTPLLHNGALYVSSYAGGVYSLDPKDGSIRWRFEVEGAGTVRASSDDDRIYFTAARAGVFCLDQAGRLIWRQSLALGGELSSPLVTGGYVMFSSATGGTYVANRHSGELYQYFDPGHGVSSEPVSDGKQVYLLSNEGYFYAFRFSDAPRFENRRLIPQPNYSETF